MIFVENEISRIIERRKEDNYIKPYETLNNIIEKNNCIKKVMESEKRDEFYNERIEKIDNLINSEEGFINLIKNSILEKDESEMNEIQKYFLTIVLSALA